MAPSSTAESPAPSSAASPIPTDPAIAAVPSNSSGVAVAEENAAASSGASEATATAGNNTSFPTWYSYIISLATVFNGFVAAFFSFISERSGKRIHGILYRDFFSERKKQNFHLARIGFYLVICGIVVSAALHSDVSVAILGGVSALITMILIGLMDSFLWWNKKDAETDNRAAAFNSIYLASNLEESTRTWEALLIKGMGQLTLGLKNQTCLLSISDIAFFLSCGYQGWQMKHEKFMQDLREKTQEDILEYTREYDVLLMPYDNNRDYFCMFQRMELHLLDTIFCDGYTVERVRLLLDAIDAIHKKTGKKNCELPPQTECIANLLLDLTVFLSYANLLIHLASNSHEDLLYLLADSMIEPHTKTDENGNDAKEVTFVFAWIKAYALFLFLDARMKESKKGKTAQEKQALLKQLVNQLEIQFDFEEILPMFDFFRKVCDLSAQQPYGTLRYSDFDPRRPAKDDAHRKICWFSDCVRYHERMKTINGG